MEKFSGEKTLMRIFIGESSRHKHRPLYEALIELFRREGFAGATVSRAVAGFGAGSIYHSEKLLRLSEDLPIIIEVVEEQAKIDAIMSQVDSLMNGGMITMEKVQVIHYQHKHK